MLDARRQQGAGSALLIRVGAAWLLVSALLLVVNWNAISQFRLPDPDDILRLVQVRDLIAGQSWFDLTQYRVDAAKGGVAMHWSRLIDLPLAAVIVALTPILGAANAELAAMIVVPAITLALAMYLAARIAWRLLGEEEALLACLIMALSIPLIFQLGPLRIDHHGWQIVFVLLAINGLMAQSAVRGGWTIGLALAAWMSISIEGLPLAAVICAVTAWRWLRDRNQRAWLVSTLQGLAIGSIALFLLTRGWSDLATYCDAIGPSHLAMFVWGAIILSILAWIEPLPRFAIWAGFAITGAGAIAIVLLAAPQCVGGGFAELDPMVREYWLNNVTEGMPIWQQTPLDIAQFAVSPLIALWAAIRLSRQSQDWARQWWGEYAAVLAAAIAISLLVARAGAVAGALAAAPLAWQVRQWLRSIRLMDHLPRRLLATLGVMIALLPAFPVIVANSIFSADHEPGVARVKSSSCNVASQSHALQGLETGEFYAPLDIAPQLLLHSEHKVVATGHHRGNQGMRFLIETALGSSEQAKASLVARGATYVALCPDLAEPRMYAAQVPDGFMADLTDGRELDWLEPVELGSDSNLKVWRIQPQ